MAQKGVNKAIILGRLGQDPEVRHTKSGDAIANLSIATSESWKDKQSGEVKEQTEWHRVVLFGRLAEVAGEYLRKGSQVYIEGQLRTRKWQDNSGVERYSTEINVGMNGILQMLDGKNNSQSDSKSGQQTGSGGTQNRSGAAGNAAKKSNEPPMDFDDDVPF